LHLQADGEEEEDDPEFGELPQLAALRTHGKTGRSHQNAGGDESEDGSEADPGGERRRHHRDAEQDRGEINKFVNVHSMRKVRAGRTVNLLLPGDWQSGIPGAKNKPGLSALRAIRD